MTRSETLRLAILCTHPIQYYVPWFRYLASTGIGLKVFFLLEPTEQGLYDQGFQRAIKWDTPLLGGYAHEFVANESSNPGTNTFGGLRNPTLTRQVLGFGPDVVLLIGYNHWSLLHFILTWRAKTAPLILRGDSHRLAHDVSATTGLRRTLIALLFKRFSAFLYVGAANRRYFTLHGVDAASLFHAPHAVDNERFSSHPDETRARAEKWRQGLAIPNRSFVFLFAGKFEEKKRPLDLLRAFRSLNSDEAALLFVGGGPLEKELRDEARDMQNVHFAPFQNQSQMPRTYAACDILVLPSFGPFETWGLAVNEAMCLGKPAIVSTHVGCAEDLVLPAQTGLVFEAGDQASLAKALATALNDREGVARWGAAARERISSYSYAEATKGLLRAAAYATRGRHA